MRCKKHLTDFSSINGVCATCLRQRLGPIHKAQLQAEAQNQVNKQPPIQFPQSVTPYIYQRKSDDAWKESSVTSNDTLKKSTLTSMIMGFFKPKKPDQGYDHKKKESRTFSLDKKGRGMSPNGENTESFKQTPRRRNGHGTSASGLKFCLSPMVQASPNVRFRGGGQVDMTYVKNRSRKFAEFGRSNNY